MLFIQFTFLITAVSALPSSTNLAARQTCTSPRVRKSWSQATVQERLAYLDAAVCITKKPSRLGKQPNATLHDDFAYTHALLNYDSKFSLYHNGTLPKGPVRKFCGAPAYAPLPSSFVCWLPTMASVLCHVVRESPRRVRLQRDCYVLGLGGRCRGRD